jgi:carbon storage regulator
MLVLSRKPGEKVIIGDDITLTIEEVRGNRVRISIAAPDQVRILRGEIVGRENFTLFEPGRENEPKPPVPLVSR